MIADIVGDRVIINKIDSIHDYFNKYNQRIQQGVTPTCNKSTVREYNVECGIQLKIEVQPIQHKLRTTGTHT